MRYAGVAWTQDGFELEVVDADGATVEGPTEYAPDRADELIARLHALGPGVESVVESTNGIIDGRMMVSGLPVHRADPWQLPDRPAFGSVPAGELARAGQRDLSALTRLRIDRGSQTGREPFLADGMAACADGLAAMTATGRCVEHGDRRVPLVALTFDDGPDPVYTNRVLDVLERYDVRATFFCVGLYGGTHREEVARMRERGHEVGNHTWSHPILPDLTRPELVAQVERAADALAETTGERPRWFRPPYGSRSPEVLEWLTELDTAVALWDVAPDDWAMPGARVIADAVVAEARPGSIILLHDGGGDRTQTVDALAPMIEGLLAEGYGFAPVDAVVGAPVAGGA